MWNILPEEIKINILIFLDYKNVIQISRVCKSINNILNSEYFWKIKLQYDINGSKFIKLYDYFIEDDSILPKNKQSIMNFITEICQKRIDDGQGLPKLRTSHLSDRMSQTFPLEIINKLKYIEYLCIERDEYPPGSELFSSIKCCFKYAAKIGSVHLVIYFEERLSGDKPNDKNSHPHSRKNSNEIMQYCLTSALKKSCKIGHLDVTEYLINRKFPDPGYNARKRGLISNIIFKVLDSNKFENLSKKQLDVIDYLLNQGISNPSCIVELSKKYQQNNVLTIISKYHPSLA